MTPELNALLESLPPHDAKLIMLRYRPHESRGVLVNGHNVWPEYWLCWKGHMTTEGQGFFIRKNGKGVTLPLQIPITEHAYEVLTTSMLQWGQYLVYGLAARGH